MESSQGKRFFEDPEHAKFYGKYRFGHPPQLIRHILDYLEEKYTGELNTCVDVGCGTGQSTRLLAPHFQRAYGVDISEAQIEEAAAGNRLPNVTYVASPAEALPFPPCSVQLVTASRSFHYFHQSRFLDEAKRVLAPSGVLAIFNCGLLPVGFPTLGRDRSDALSSALRHVDGLMTDYWTDARSTFSLEDFQLPMNEAKTFRFGEIHSDISMDADGLVGYVQTWSAYGRMKEKEGKDRMDAIASDLRRRQDRLRQRFSLGSNPFPDDLWSPPSQVGEGAVPR